MRLIDFSPRGPYIIIMQARKELLVVGSGLTGSLVAALLAKARPDIALSVWDKAKGTGGRMSTYRFLPSSTSSHSASSSSSRPLPHHVDMGAQYITRSHGDTLASGIETSSDYRQLRRDTYEELIAGGTLVPFAGAIVGEVRSSSDDNFIAPQGMSSVSRHYLYQSKAAAVFQRQLRTVIINGPQICCIAADGSEFACNSLVLTMPVPQLLSLDGNLMSSIAVDTRTKLEAVAYSSRYALGLFYDSATSSVIPHYDWSAKFVSDNDTIRYVSWDTAKRDCNGLGEGKSLLIHTSVPFGLKHLESDKATVQSLILESLDEILPGLPTPADAHVVRWCYSQVYRDHVFHGQPGYAVLSQSPLVVATGDGFSGSTFEECLWSAHATVNVVASTL